jgi:hypothetical protein
MSKYHIVCTDLMPVNAPRQHQHIVSVGVDTDKADNYANEKHSLQTVIDNIREKKDVYYTIGHVTGRQAAVEVAHCPACGHLIIKTRPDDTRDDNLETMRTCQWRAS